MPKNKALVATGNSMLTAIHALLSDPQASYTHLSPDYYEQRMDARRQACNHVLSLERLGCKVAIQVIKPDTGEILPRLAESRSPLPQPAGATAPPGAAACPAEVLFSDQLPCE